MPYLYFESAEVLAEITDDELLAELKSRKNETILSLRDGIRRDLLAAFHEGDARHFEIVLDRILKEI